MRICYLVPLLALLFAIGVLADTKATIDGEWPTYGRDPGGSRYSPLDQVNRSNVAALKIAWTYRTGAVDVKGRSVSNAAFEATPILVDGTLYLSTPFNRVIALDPVSGMERWAFDPKVDMTKGYSEVTCRGVSTWADRRTAVRRIYVATIDARLIALDAKTGALCKDFGQGGEIDLTRDVRLVDRGDYQVTSPPAVIGDLIVVGSSMGDNRGVELERGVVRAFDARTGTLRWSWDPIPTSGHRPCEKNLARRERNTNRRC
jgi:quinoprotein glucose dehydrogenase